MATERIIFWNLYNVFSGIASAWTANPDKSLSEDAMAAGIGQFNARVDAMADRLADFSGDAQGPSILGVCEVEMNSFTLAALTDRLNTTLSTTYTCHFREVRSNRAICSALLTRHTVTATVVMSYEWRVIRTQLSNGGHTVYFYTCHWPSKLGDELGDRRKVLASIINADISALGSGAKAVVWGDLNDTISDPSISTYLKASASPGTPTWPEVKLYAGMSGGHLTGLGTHYHEGVASMIDHVCWTPNMTSPTLPYLDPASVTIHTTGVSQGGRPWRYTNGQGFSDHYPISVEITWN